MFSKRCLKLSCLALIFLGTAGCDLPLNENPPEAKPIEVSLGEATGCLSKVIPVAGRYFSGEAQNVEVEATWNCMATAVSTFEQSVQGRYEDRFTDREVAHFIEQYFVEDGTRLPDALTLEIFRIKQLFVGGGLYSITRTEMKNLTTVIYELKRITLRLNPYMKVLSFNWKPEATAQLDREHFEGANQEIQQAAKDLAILIEKNGLPYRFENVTKLLHQFQSFADASWGWIDDVDKTMPLVQKLKKALAGGSEDEIAPNEWRRFALLGGRGYIQYLRYHYFIKSQDFTKNGDQLSYFFLTSISDLFSYLGDMVDGKPGQMLTRVELLEMLEAMSSLAPKLKVSDELILEIMRIKVVFFGGREDFFVKADFDRAQGKLDSFRILTEKFLKYSEVYGLDWKPDTLPPADVQPHFDQAEQTLIQVGQNLGENMEDRYDLQNLVHLAEEIDKLYPSTNPNKESLFVTLQKFMPLVISVKNILFSDYPSSAVGVAHSSLPSRDQWKDFLAFAAKIYSRYMSYEYFVKGHSPTKGYGLRGFGDLVNKTLGMVDELIDRKQINAISLIELNRVWDAAIKAEFLPAKVSLQTLDATTKIVLQKALLSPEDRLAGNIPDGLTKVATKTLTSEFAIWLKNEEFLDDIVYAGVPANTGKSAADILSDLSSAQQGVTGYQELQMIFTSPLALSFDSMGRIAFSKPSKNYLRKTADMMNLIRAAVRLATRAYGTDLARIRNYDGLTLDETNALYTDVKPLVNELNLIHPDNKEFATSRFRDANLFTPLANGDSLASFREIHQLFMMILSGLKVDSLMYDVMVATGSPNQGSQGPICAVDKHGSDYSDDWTTNLRCVIDFYRREMQYAFSSMPQFMLDQMMMDSTRYEAMFMNLLKSAGHKETGNNIVHIGDLALVPHVSQYIEGVFQIYDLDGNGILITTEAMAAYPTYKETLRQVSGLSSEKDLRGLFSYMLKNGKPPQTFAEKLSYKAWCQRQESSWNLTANRERLAQILGFIAEEMEKQRESGTEPGLGIGSGTGTGSGDTGTGAGNGTGTSNGAGDSGTGAGAGTGDGSGAGTDPGAGVIVGP